MKRIQTMTSIGLVALSLALSACQKEQAVQKPDTETASQDEIKKVSIGFQKSSLTLLVARDEKFIEQQFPHAEVEWKEFPAGPQLLEALNARAIDFGHAADHFVDGAQPDFR